MTFLHAIILGIVEGVTEFLPISSTGHLVLVSNLLRIPVTDFLKTFEIFIQVGAITAILLLFASKLRRDPRQVIYMAIGFLPAAVVGFLVYGIVKQLLGSPIVVAISFIAGGIILLCIERRSHDRGRKLTPFRAFVVGCYQIVALIPGISRSGATIVGGMLIGMSREQAVEYSFLLAVPTLAAAAAYDLYKTGIHLVGNQSMLLAVGFVTAFVSAYACIRWFIKFVSTRSLASFGWYRIVIGIVFLIFFLW